MNKNRRTYKKSRLYREESEGKNIIKYVIGVEEAGRGPVLGPMIMVAAACKEEDEPLLKKIGVKDSKQVSPENRTKLLSEIKKVCEYKLSLLTPETIDASLSGENDNLNLLEVRTSAELIIRLIARLFIKEFVKQSKEQNRKKENKKENKKDNGKENTEQNENTEQTKIIIERVVLDSPTVSLNKYSRMISKAIDDLLRESKTPQSDAESLDAKSLKNFLKEFLKDKGDLNLLTNCAKNSEELLNNPSIELLFQEIITTIKNLNIISENKADINHPIVSAASIIAKVKRDEEMRKIRSETKIDLGSGYPSDPKTIAFLKKVSKELVIEGKNVIEEKYPFIRKEWASFKKIVSTASQKDLSQFLNEREAEEKKEEERVSSEKERFKKLLAKGYDFEPVKSPYELFRMRGNSAIIIKYKSGKILVQGPSLAKEATIQLLKSEGLMRTK